LNSEILNRLGLGNFDIGLLLIGICILFIFSIVLLMTLIRQGKEIKKLRIRLKRFMTGKDAESLEDEFGILNQEVKSLKQIVDISKKDIEVLFQQFRSAYQKTGLVKYDAFQQMGGQLSFCLVLLDQDDNGFIINSVHSTEGSYCYTKEVKQGISDVDLGKEEKEALDMALNNNK